MKSASDPTTQDPTQKSFLLLFCKKAVLAFLNLNNRSSRNMSRKWFITGVSSGLGRDLALAALAAGDLVAGSVRSDDARRAFNALHPQNAKAYVMDVTDAAAVTAAIARAEAETGGIEILVNNAGFSFIGTLEESDWTDIRAVFETNFFGALAVIKAALPFMRQRRRGTIVNVTSLAGYAAGSGVGLYAGTKLALEGISKGLAKELAPFGIGVMIVVPGAFRTDLGKNRLVGVDRIDDYAAQNEALRRQLAALTGQQRGDPQKAAAAILKAVAVTPLPRYLALGPDAVDNIAADLDAIKTDLQQWDQLSRSTDLVSG
jgi:NAD(P)-dependent dehydrogenase (short-subunit alcohol dehydrogenase family)